MSADLLTMLADSVRDLFGRVGALEAKETGLLIGGWGDLRVPVTTTRKAANAPGFTVFKTDGVTPGSGVNVEWFDKNTREELFFTAQLSHRYKEGTDIISHVHWVPKSNGGANQFVKWALEYTWANIGDIFGDTVIIYSNIPNTAAAATIQGDVAMIVDKHYVTELPAISGAGKLISSMLVCRIFRTAAHVEDDYDDDAGLLEIDFHYEVDTIAAREEYVK